MGKNLKGKEIEKGISQRKDGRYQVRYTDRYGERQTLYARTESTAREMLANARKENALRETVKKRYLFRDWYEEWMDVYKAPVIRPNTKRRYEEIFRLHILPVLGKKYLSEVQSIDIQKLINELNLKGLGWETQDKVRTLIKDLFNVAIRNDYAIKNPAVNIKILAEKPDERIVLTRDAQVEFMTCSAGTFYDHLYVVALNTGLRPGEICALTEDDIDFEKGEISITKTLLYQKLDGDTKKTFHLSDPKTYASKRTVAINKNARKALEEQIVLKRLLSERYPKEGEFANLLFVSRFNNPLCSQILCDSIKRIVDEINLQRDTTEQFPVFPPHTFRHTFATRFVEQDGNFKALQKILGHASLKMTMDLYAHATDDFKRSEMERIENDLPIADVPIADVLYIVKAGVDDGENED